MEGKGEGKNSHTFSNCYTSKRHLSFICKLFDVPYITFVLFIPAVGEGVLKKTKKLYTFFIFVRGSELVFFSVSHFTRFLKKITRTIKETQNLFFEVLWPLLLGVAVSLLWLRRWECDRDEWRRTCCDYRTGGNRSATPITSVIDPTIQSIRGLVFHSRIWKANRVQLKENDWLQTVNRCRENVIIIQFLCSI